MFMKLEAAALEHVPAPDQVLEELRPALQRIWNAVETAIHRTIDFFTAEGVPVDASLAPNLVRYYAKRYLDENDLPEEIELDFERQELGNNGLLVKCGPHHLRILKSDDGRPPVPGYSETKKDFYQQPLPLIAIAGPGEALKPLRLLVLWDALPKSYGFQGLSLVLPRAGGETRESVHWHWLRTIDEAFITMPLLPMPDSGQVPSLIGDDLDITAKPLPATGSGHAGQDVS